MVSINKKILFVVVSAFLITAVSVILLTNVHQKKIIDTVQTNVFSEKLNTILAALWQNYHKLEDTLMIEAYERDFKKNILLELEKTHYLKNIQHAFPVIIDKNGHVILSISTESNKKTVIDSTIIQQLIALKNGEITVTDKKGKKLWCISQEFTPWDWVIAYVVPPHIKYANAITLRNRLLFVIALISGVAMLCLTLIMVRFTLPITQLTEAAREIQSGNLNKRVSAHSNDEIGELALAFNEMTNKLQHSLEGLEKEIQNRTKVQEERGLLEKQLRQAQKMESIGTLAGGIAHDFNNILYPILGYSELLINEFADDERIKSIIEGIYSGANRAKDLVLQILTFSNGENAEIHAMKIQFIIKEVMKMLRATIPKTIEIHQQIDTKCSRIEADPTQVHQIIMNLATNAYHAMEEHGGTMTIGLNEIELGQFDLSNLNLKIGTYACLTIKDTGIGIKDNTVNKIFDPFFTTKEKGKGTGMGLSVVHGIVNGMGGDIQVNSTYGKGTEFNVYFPVKKGLVESPPLPVEDAVVGGTERIMIVDDEDNIIAMEKELLERIGYQVTLHTKSRDALEEFRAAPDLFDLVLTDLTMPKLPGDKFAVELLKIKPDIPIILCTGYSSKMSSDAALEMGCKDLIMKPTGMKELSKKVRTVLNEAKE